jgi:hypothetical protein
MELKKHPDLELRKDRPLFLFIGFAFSLIITLILFTYTSYEDIQVFDMPLLPQSRDAESIENTFQNSAPPPPPATISEQFETVDNETTIVPLEKPDPVLDPSDNSDAGPSDGGGPAGDEFVYDVGLEEKVNYRGGEDALSDFLYANLSYPLAARTKHIEGSIMVIFTVEKDGSVSNIGTDGKGNTDLALEAIRVIKLSSGNWVPGKMKKKQVRSICRMPIVFKLSVEDF